jgi:hypothetical protein
MDFEQGQLGFLERKERESMARNEQTSKSVGTKASKQLSNPQSKPAQKSVAGSALTQRPDHKSTSKKSR